MSVLPRRRALGLAASGLAGSALLGAAGIAPAEEPGDERVAERALRRERAAEAAYRALAANLGRGAERRLLQLLATHARAHADALAEALGTSVEEPPGGTARAPAGRGARAALETALAVAERLVGGHLEGIGRLESASLARTLASVAAADGQQVVVIRAALGREEITEAFGSAPPP